MGCNFYTQKPSEEDWDDEYEYHIGKRSAAGIYCWDCMVSLNKFGEDEVHNSHIAYDQNSMEQITRQRKMEWYDECPECGKSAKKESLGNSSIGRELGFNKNPHEKKTGVASCSSFRWAMKPDHFVRKVVDIWDEYGKKYSLEEFESILEECPIRFYNSIGKEFS